MKVIPENALDIELSQSDSKSTDIAQKEQNRIEQGKYAQHLQDSKDSITLFLDWLFKIGIGFLFFLACIITLSILAGFGCLIYHYMKYLIADIERLETFLHDTWKVLSGASLILFAQFLVWTIKNRDVALKNRNKI